MSVPSTPSTSRRNRIIAVTALVAVLAVIGTVITVKVVNKLPKPAQPYVAVPSTDFFTIDLTFGQPSTAPNPQAISGEISGLTDKAGYTYDVSFRLSYSDVVKDISQSPPGRAQATFTATYAAKITNTTEGRAAPLGNLRTFGVAGAFPEDSAVCGQRGLGNIWEVSQGALSGFCFVYLIPTFLPEQGLDSGAAYDASKVVELGPQDTEANTDLIVSELAAGPAFWLATREVEPGLVSSCDNGPGSTVVWMSSAAVDCPGALIAPAPVAIDTGADLAGGADVGFAQTRQPFYDSTVESTESGNLSACPFGSLQSVTTGLANPVEPTDSFYNTTAEAGLASITCYSNTINVWVRARAAGSAPLDSSSISNGDGVSAEFPYLGGTVLVWCHSDLSECHPLWYSDKIIIEAAGGAGGNPQAQLDWFVKDLPTMLTNLAIPTS